MIKQTVKFTDFDDKEQEEDLYFNLNEVELTELEVAYEGGWAQFLSQLKEGKDNAKILDEMQKIFLAAYGEKSADGRYFEKSEEISKRFKQSAMYPAFFREITTDGNKMLTFLIGIFPKQMQEELAKNIEKAEKEDKAQPPRPPGSGNPT